MTSRSIVSPEDQERHLHRIILRPRFRLLCDPSRRTLSPRHPLVNYRSADLRLLARVVGVEPIHMGLERRGHHASARRARNPPKHYERFHSTHKLFITCLHFVPQN